MDSQPITEFENPLPPDAISLELNGEQMRSLTERAMEFVIEHINSLPEQPVKDLDGAQQLAESYKESMPSDGSEFESFLPQIESAVKKTFNTPSPGYLAFIPGGGIFPAAVADYLALAVNRYVGMWNAAPLLVQMELTAIDWIRESIRLPDHFGGILTSGGSISNLIAVITARRNCLPENFLKGIIYTSKEAHHCVAKSALLAGFPESNIRYIETDDRLRIKVDSLTSLIETDRNNGLTPFLVVANAGTTNTGAIDPLPEIATICRDQNIWFHVDAAYGGFFRMVDEGEKLIPGLELADSIVLDPHKGLFVPYGTGCLLVRDREQLRKAHHLGADYLQDLDSPDGTVNFADVSPELSREFRGLRIWLPFKLYGVDAFRDNLREKLELTRWAYDELKASPGFEIFDPPQLSVVAFRYIPNSGDVNEFNDRLCRRILEKNRVFLTSTLIDGNFYIRIAVLSFRTHGEQMRQAVEDIRNSAMELEQESVVVGSID